MKTKSILISLCLIFGIAISQSFAQDNNNRTVQGWVQGSYWSPVFCGDQLVDILEGGVIRLHYVIHYTDGVYTWETDQIKGEVTSSTGEVFKISEVDKTYFTDHWYITWHYNLVGDMGTHYTGVLTYSYYTGKITVEKTVCR